MVARGRGLVFRRRLPFGGLTIKENMQFGASLLIAAVCAQPVVACDLCAVYAATEAQGGSGQGGFGGVAEQFAYFNTLHANGHDVANDGDQYIKSSLSQVFAGYNFNDRIGVQFNLPIIYRSYGYGSARGSELGIGDVSLMGNA